MSSELKRFFDSIGFVGEGFNDSSILKVVLKKDTQSFIVYIKNKEVCIVDFNGQKLNKEAIPIYFEMSNYGVKPLYISLNAIIY